MEYYESALYEQYLNSRAYYLYWEKPVENFVNGYHNGQIEEISEYNHSQVNSFNTYYEEAIRYFADAIINNFNKKHRLGKINYKWNKYILDSYFESFCKQVGFIHLCKIYNTLNLKIFSDNLYYKKELVDQLSKEIDIYSQVVSKIEPLFKDERMHDVNKKRLLTDVKMMVDDFTDINLFYELRNGKKTKD